ncbi:GNAT family N-acetyltransferase [Arsukibacterium sp.]|uniref:GNAT family N-acetyltransferase n=1 Tax=Arsukibacterium sp. TaxID=1977258 RepID=UPI001BD4AEA8|nr:GNAT family N-acetyltransferase [Arsukibacterium sp.]
MVEHDPQWDSGYHFFPEFAATSADNRYLLRPIHWNDRDAIREWRNAQIDVLRQQNPLSTSEQDNYFSNLVLPQLTQEQPEQILFAFLEDSQLVGDGGFVHIVWSDRRAEVSFLTDVDRSEQNVFSQDWSMYLSLLVQLARRIGFHKLTTETYSIRPKLIEILEDFGFTQEGILRDHHLINGEPVDSFAHAYLIN